MQNKQIWIFGGAGYLGNAITGALDSLCEKIVCIDLDRKAHELVETRSLNRTKPVSMDVSESSQLERFLENLVESEGLPQGMVNLTYASSIGKRLEQLSAAEFQATFDQTVTAFFTISRFLAERMKAAGRGSIVNFASMYGLLSPDPQMYAPPMTPNPIDYGASKAAIIQMTRYLAVHYGPSNVRLNCVAPGSFPNPQVQTTDPDFIKRIEKRTPMARVGQNDEIIGPVTFLLGDGASYVTGQTLCVDGGWTAW